MYATLTSSTKTYNQLIYKVKLTLDLRPGLMNATLSVVVSYIEYLNCSRCPYLAPTYPPSELCSGTVGSENGHSHVKSNLKTLM